MFSVDRSDDVSLLIHVHPCMDRIKLPKALRFFFKTVFMYVGRPFANKHSNAFIELSKWRLTEIVSTMPIKNFHSALFKLGRLVFMQMEMSLQEYERNLIEGCYRLKASSRGDLSIVNSYISALLNGSKTAYDDCFAGSISRDDPAYVSDLVRYIKDIFSFSRLRGGHPEWFLRPDVNGLTDSFLAMLISGWEDFIISPYVLFNDNSPRSLTILNLLYTNSTENKFYSLQCVSFLFSCFLLEFFKKNCTSSSLRKDVMVRFFKHVINSVSIFLRPDLGSQCCLNLMYITGCIINATNATEWDSDNVPIIVKKIKVSDGTIICCSPVQEEWKSFSLSIEEIKLTNFINFVLSLYNEQGRTAEFHTLNYNFEIGGLFSSCIWKEWHSELRSFFSCLLSRTEVRYKPSSLYRISSFSALNCIFRNLAWQENINLFVDALFLSASNNKMETSCLRSQLDNLFSKSMYLYMYKRRVSFDLLLLDQFVLFLNKPEISISSDKNNIESCRRFLKTIICLLPFCETNLLNFFQSYAICKWLLEHFFDVGIDDSSEKEAIMYIGSLAFGEFIWKLIFTSIRENGDNQHWRLVKKLFLRRVMVLYLVCIL